MMRVSLGFSEGCPSSPREEGQAGHPGAREESEEEEVACAGAGSRRRAVRVCRVPCRVLSRVRANFLLAWPAPLAAAQPDCRTNLTQRCCIFLFVP